MNLAVSWTSQEPRRAPLRLTASEAAALLGERNRASPEVTLQALVHDERPRSGIHTAEVPGEFGHCFVLVSSLLQKLVDSC